VPVLRRGGGGDEGEGHRMFAARKTLFKEHTRQIIRSKPPPSMPISLSSTLVCID
jgi:hypothetical protein